ncbi:MAG: tetratricopeptide repeat protein [Isosphaeraceae bacterium]|nr:tetratricopeptide repeat protein [Isosphaeraceae bacterium]
MTMLTLRIDPHDPPPGWTGRWFVAGQPIGEPFEVVGAAARSTVELSRRFLNLFERGGPTELKARPYTAPEALRALGRELFATWFEPGWAAVKARLAATGPHQLVVQSTGHDVLNLPWELVELDSERPVGCDAAWALCRSPLDGPLEAGGPLRPGPLRILFLASAPSDQAQLDYEREEDAMLRAIARLQDVSVLFAESGTFDALKELVAECRPHVVHLSGHGTVDREGMGSFAFEDERGRTDSREAATIVAEVFRGGHHGVRCVFFNGCRTSQAAAAGLCQSLAVAGVPLAVGWSASVADDRATDFTEEFYRRLVGGEAVPIASAHARESIRRKGLVRQGVVQLQDATFALPQVYASAADGSLYDRGLPPERQAGPRTRYVLLGDGIKGLREGFIGRRHELQRLVPALRDGETTFAVLTGIGGAGKSTLATRAANRLESAGFHAVPVRAENDVRGPAEAGRALLTRLTGALDDEFIRVGRQDLHHQLTDGNFPPDQRLRLAVKGLNELRLVVVIDNFEDVLDLETRRIADEDLAGFYRVLATGLMQGSRVIVTCRYLPARTPTGEPTVMHLPLVDFTASDFRKFLRRDALVEARIARGELSADLLRSLYQAFGGTPGFLDNVRKVLRHADPDALRDDLEGVSPGALSEARESYYQRIITHRLYEALPPNARDVARRLAVSELPLPVDAVAELVETGTGTLEPALNACVDFGLLQRFDDADGPSLYHPPGLLRPWLADPERLPEPDARAIDRRLAAFWRLCLETNRGAELRVPIDVELTACRVHARRGGDRSIFRWATVTLGRRLERRVEWFAARDLLNEIADDDRDAESLRALASVENSLGEWKTARTLLERAQSLAGDRAGEAIAWHQLATIDLNEGDYPAAREKLSRALEIIQTIGDRAGEAAAWHQLALIDLNQSDYPAAREKFARALQITQAIGVRAGEATTWHNLASIDANEGDYPAAREKFARALGIRQAIGDRAGEADTWHNLATIDLNEGDYLAARERLARALGIRQAIGDRAGEAASWHQLAAIDFSEGDYPAAREKFARALGIRQAIGDRAGEADTWHNLASIDLNEGSHSAAREKLAWSLEVKQAIGDRAGEAATLHQLATIDLNEGNYLRAREKFARSLEVTQAIGDRAGEAAAFVQLGDLACKLGRNHEGARLVAICCLIDQVIRHGNTMTSFRTLAGLCQSLGYDQAQFDAVLEEAGREYQRDRGRALIERALAEGHAPDAGDPGAGSGP